MLLMHREWMMLLCAVRVINMQLVDDDDDDTNVLSTWMTNRKERGKASRPGSDRSRRSKADIGRDARTRSCWTTTCSGRPLRIASIDSLMIN